MVQRVMNAFPEGLERLCDPRGEVAKNFRVKGYVGSVSFITSMTSNFCGDCNRYVFSSFTRSQEVESSVTLVTNTMCLMMQGCVLWLMGTSKFAYLERARSA